jgi:hypothetical protein
MEMVSDASNSLPPLSVEVTCWMIQLSIYTHQRSEPSVLTWPENGGRNSLRIVGHQLLFSHGDTQITVLYTQWPWQWQIQNKNVLFWSNGVEFVSLLRSSAAAKKLRRVVHTTAHARRHWLPHIAAPTADSWRRCPKSTIVEIALRYARITTDPQFLPLQECQQSKYICGTLNVANYTCDTVTNRFIPQACDCSTRTTKTFTPIGANDTALLRTRT